MLIDFPQRIKYLREKHKITQAALAKRLDISRNAVNSWEMGLSFPSVANIIELTRIFKVSADYLLALSNEQTINVSKLTEDQKDVIYDLIAVFEKK